MTMANEAKTTGDAAAFWAVMWPIVTAILGSLCTWYFVQQQRERDLAMRPPVAVMNLSEWVLKSGAGSTDADRFRNGGERADEAARKFEEHGVLVLDSRFVRGAPNEVRVSAPEPVRK